jgi:hypothetical protein
MRSIMTCGWALVILMIGASSATGRDVNDPPWDASLPNQTSQAWEFDLHPGPTPVLDENDYGVAELTVFSGTYPDIVPGPDGDPITTWHIGPEGGLSIYIPNNPDPNLQKLIFWQITSDKAPGPSGPTSNPPGTNSYPYPHTQWPNSNWYTYNGLITIPYNPPEEWIYFDFPESTNIEEVVIDTICIPEPAALSLLVLGGMIALRHRRS